MTGEVIRGDNLDLVLPTLEEVFAFLENMSPSDRAEVSPDWIARVKASTAPDPWLHGFSIVHRASGAVIGSCGYKGHPDSDATVEIAYAVSEAHRGRGHATEAAGALVRFAFESGEVSVVRAHTLDAEGASARVLTKCGFAPLGQVIDPEDGLVWRWEVRTTQPIAAPAS
jgi:RimJ/RimL family protein N-acetyltransferase